MPTDVTVVVVSYNVREYTLACLDSVRRFGGALSVEPIAVDNASRDGSVDAIRARFPEIRVIANERNLGFTAANNQAILLSHGRHILLLNSDAEVREGSLERMVRHMDEHVDVGILGPRLVYADGAHQLSVNPFPDAWGTFARFTQLSRCFPESRLLAPHRHVLAPRDFPRTVEVDWVSGACLLARRETLEEIGLLDEAFFMYCEETDLCRRAWDAGWKVAYFPQATVLHHGQRSVTQEKPICLEHSNRSLVHYACKHAAPAGREAIRAMVLFYAWARRAALRVRWWLRHETDDAARLGSCQAICAAAMRRDPGPQVPSLPPAEPSTPTTVSVVVPTYRRGWEDVGDTLRALSAQETPAVEVLIVDQTPSPDPRIPAFARTTPRFRYMHIDTPGLPNARNVGAREAGGEVVAYIDDDAVPVPGWVGAHAWRYRNPGVVGVVGRVVIPGRSRSRRARCRVGRFRHFDADFVDNYDAEFRTEVDSLTGCNLSVRRSALLAAGGFRVEYGGTAHLEETDLSLHLLRRGGRLVFEPAAEVEHRVVATGGCRAPDLARWAYWYARNYALLFCSHFEGWGAWPFVATRIGRLILFSWEARSLAPLGSGLSGLLHGLLAARGIASRTRDLPRFTSQLRRRRPSMEQE